MPCIRIQSRVERKIKVSEQEKQSENQEELHPDQDIKENILEKEIEEVEENKKTCKKKMSPKKKQDKMKEKVEELEDRVKRQMAEFENFRKRGEKEKSTMFEMGVKSTIDKILPVVDNFERGLQAIPEGEEEGSFAEGMRMIYKQLMSSLEEIGIQPIEAVGVEFNPEFHNAVMQVENEELETGVVAQELQKGYHYRSSVIRHSMVAVVS